MALEWGTDYDIRVNGIAPGPIGDTPGMSKLDPKEIKNKTRDHMPLFKIGDKWDIAMASLYLVSDAGKLVYLVYMTKYYNQCFIIIYILLNFKKQNVCFCWGLCSLC